jgi:hypothetical protein
MCKEKKKSGVSQPTCLYAVEENNNTCIIAPLKHYCGLENDNNKTIKDEEEGVGGLRV